MTKYIVPLILSICYSTPLYACDCLPFVEEPPTKFVSFTITNVKDAVYEAMNKKKQLLTFTRNQVTDGNVLYKGDIVLVEETNDNEGKSLGVELFIPYDQVEAE